MWLVIDSVISECCPHMSRVYHWNSCLILLVALLSPDMVMSLHSLVFGILVWQSLPGEVKSTDWCRVPWLVPCSFGQGFLAKHYVTLLSLKIARVLQYYCSHLAWDEWTPSQGLINFINLCSRKCCLVNFAAKAELWCEPTKPNEILYTAF